MCLGKILKVKMVCWGKSAKSNCYLLSQFFNDEFPLNCRMDHVKGRGEVCSQFVFLLVLLLSDFRGRMKKTTCFIKNQILNAVRTMHLVKRGPVNSAVTSSVMRFHSNDL